MNDPDLHLFVDDAEIQHYVNLVRVLNKPSRLPQPVLRADRPWEGDRAQAWGSVIREPGHRLRMWYFAMNTARKPGELDRGGYALAESMDGRHWSKPDLGVVRYRGSSANNLWYTFSPDGDNLVEFELARRGEGLPATDENGDVIGVLNNMDGLTVVRDEDDPDPDRRYKLIANMQDHRMWAPYYKEQYPDVTPEQVEQARAVWGQYLDTSPDGVHWTRRPRRLLPMRHGDYMMVTRDERNGRWWLNERALNLFGRNAALRTSTDLVNWTDPAEMAVFNQPDSGFGHAYEWHGGITPFNYGNLNLGFLERWCNAGYGDGCELVSNRDGQPWQRVCPGTLFLDTGPAGSFDRVLVYPTHNLPIENGEKIFLFYTGGAAGTGAGMPMAMGMMWIMRDRFAGMAHSRREPGELITKPLTIERDKLEVNAERLFAGVVQVGVRRPDGEFIDGYGLDDCRVDLAGGARTAVRWKNKADLRELRGRTVWLHFRVDGAALYAYRLYD